MESQKSLKEDWFLWLLVVLALGLTGGYYYYGFKSDSTEEASPGWVFNGVDKKSVQGIKKHKGDTLVLSVRRDSNGNWTLERPSGIELDQSAVNDWLKTVLSPEVKRRFTPSPGADYGFSPASPQLEIIRKHRRQTLYLGGKTPTGQGFYLRAGQGETAPIFVVANRNRSKLASGLYTIRDKELFEQDHETLESFSLRTESDSITYRRSGKRWLIASGRNTTLNETATRNLDESLENLVGSTASSFYDTSPPSAYEPLQGSIHLRFGQTRRVVSLGGKEDDERLIKIDDSPVVGVSQDPVRLLDDVPVKPDGWPELSESRPSPAPTSGSQSGNRPSAEQLKKLRKRMQKSR